MHQQQYELQQAVRNCGICADKRHERATQWLPFLLEHGLQLLEA